MPSRSRHERLTRKCISILAEAVSALPDLLARSDPEAAAAIVADLLKFQLSQPVADKPLDEIVAEIMHN